MTRFLLARNYFRKKDRKIDPSSKLGWRRDESGSISEFIDLKGFFVWWWLELNGTTKCRVLQFSYQLGIQLDKMRKLIAPVFISWRLGGCFKAVTCFRDSTLDMLVQMHKAAWHVVGEESIWWSEHPGIVSGDHLQSPGWLSVMLRPRFWSGGLQASEGVCSHSWHLMFIKQFRPWSYAASEIDMIAPRKK